MTRDGHGVIFSGFSSASSGLSAATPTSAFGWSVCWLWSYSGGTNQLIVDESTSVIRSMAITHYHSFLCDFSFRLLNSIQ